MKKVNISFTLFVAGLTLSMPFYPIIKYSWTYVSLLPFCDLNISYASEKVNRFSFTNFIDIFISDPFLIISTGEALNLILIISFMSTLLINDKSFSMVMG